MSRVTCTLTLHGTITQSKADELLEAILAAEPDSFRKGNDKLTDPFYWHRSYTNDITEMLAEDLENAGVSWSIWYDGSPGEHQPGVEIYDKNGMHQFLADPDARKIFLSAEEFGVTGKVGLAIELQALVNAGLKIVPDESEEENFSDEQFIVKAREIYTNDDIEIDDEPSLSHTDNGAWVQAWVFVNNEELK